MTQSGIAREQRLLEIIDGQVTPFLQRQSGKLSQVKTMLTRHHAGKGLSGRDVKIRLNGQQPHPREIQRDLFEFLPYSLGIHRPVIGKERTVGAECQQRRSYHVTILPDPYIATVSTGKRGERKRRIGAPPSHSGTVGQMFLKINPGRKPRTGKSGHVQFSCPRNKIFLRRTVQRTASEGYLKAGPILA